jgi:hypothetical protein
MSTGAPPPSPRVPGELIAGLVDDASLFPPAELDMASALAEHRSHVDGPYNRLLGRFLCAASRLAELQRHLRSDEVLHIGLVMDTGARGIAEAVARACEDRRLTLDTVEVPLSPEAELSAAAHAALRELARLPGDVRGFVELPRVLGWRDALSLVAARRRGAKLRTGGLVAEAFPTELEVASFVHGCLAEGAPFKCTAGLHHAVRHRGDRTGFEHHGFLNILLATCWAVRGASVGELAEVLAERDPHDLQEELATIDQATAEQARRHFVAFGCCSFEEPVADLTGLALVEKSS